MASGIRFTVGFIRALASGLLDFIYPPFCGICGQRLTDGEKNICRMCWGSLAVIEQPYCRLCGLPLDLSGPVCPVCRSRQRHFSFARSFGIFDERLQRILHLFKYRRRRSLAEPLAQMLLLVIRQDRRFEAMEAIVPVPLHSAKARARGYNQSELIAARLSRKAGINLLKDVLLRVRNTPSQSSLGLTEREKNVRDAFRVRDSKAISGKRLILLDDVLTTGATADACAGVLLKAGVKELCVLTVARTPEPRVPTGTS